MKPIIVEAVTRQEENILHNLMQFYIYEFTRFQHSIKLEENGAFKPFNLKDYWENPHLHAFFFKVDGEQMGFALVESAHEEEPNTMQEFFIMAKYGGKGYGQKAASQLFQRFPGKWHIVQIEKNYPAQAFWRSLTYRMTNGAVSERYENRKSIQEFHTDDMIS
ncbi:GNAT family N-acetyltransferase [Radiobacillus kanasensis]|uniref:GNAT family N-acetyltransferase n=1 Tax=Radiobacillus kanasensis TaxID=2844358 RepID=UPI001E3C8062|nr:GNAT family N-acetyltransferase [Radiobacillus kanasensis]UFU00421.1 GNAT family N-acetyltransferase [Radiobacillus kanasensis]